MQYICPKIKQCEFIEFIQSVSIGGGKDVQTDGHQCETWAKLDQDQVDEHVPARGLGGIDNGWVLLKQLFGHLQCIGAAQCRGAKPSGLGWALVTQDHRRSELRCLVALPSLCKPTGSEGDHVARVTTEAHVRVRSCRWCIWGVGHHGRWWWANPSL